LATLYLGPSGDLVEFVGTVMDVTERRRAEEDRQARAHAIRIMTMGQLTASMLMRSISDSPQWSPTHRRFALAQYAAI